MTFRTLLPLAHGGEDHWYDTIMFTTPMLVIVGFLLVTVYRDRRADAKERAANPDSADQPADRHAS